MGRPSAWASDLTGRPVERPPAGRREHRQRFWVAVARGVSSEDAAVEAGVSPVVGVRRFREGATLGHEPAVSCIARAPRSGMRPAGLGARSR